MTPAVRAVRAALASEDAKCVGGHAGRSSDAHLVLERAWRLSRAGVGA